MTIHTTRWRPDTCSCIVEYTWDDEVPAEQRTHTVSNYIKTCDFHLQLPDNDQKWNTVKEENQRKNLTLLETLTNGPAALSDLVEGSLQLKQNVTYNFSWSGTAPNRVLTISFTGINLTTQQRNAIQNFLNNKFGVGKVIIG